MAGRSTAVPEATATSSPRVEARRADRREEILEAAWELAREEGLVGLSLRRLADRLGMRAPSLYAYFDSKDAIYDGMFVRGYADFAEAFGDLDQQVAEGVDDAHALLSTMARRHLAFCNDDPARFQLLFQHAIPGWHPSPEAWAVAVEVYARMVEAFAAIGITDPGVLDQWTAITTGLASQQVANDPGGDRWLRQVDDVVAMFLAHHAPDA